ncbi:MAG: adenosylcobinamide amidohydrolase [Candidatus Rokuibacteriota bacterium]
MIADTMEGLERIEGVRVEVGREAVVVTADRALDVVSSAVAGGGFGRARTVVNLHVPKHTCPEDVENVLEAFVRERGLPAPWLGLCTAAWTERARIAVETLGDTRALVVATVGLGNRVAAGITPVAAAAASTINTIVVVDADAEPAALVNLVATVTEVKTALLLEAGVRCDDGAAATGTSTDAVVVAATGRGGRRRFGGPISELGWLVARAARGALGEGIRGWR